MDQSRPRPPLMVAEGLTKSFGETRALRAADLRVLGGGIEAVIGENGSGKSTLVKLLTGVMRPDAGTIRLEGQLARFASPRTARDAGIVTVFQEVLVLEELSVLDNLWLGQDGLFHRSIPAQRRVTEADRVLRSLLGRTLDLDARVADLDLGSRQTIVIARALLLQPKLLILDEATAALDIGVRDRLFDLLRLRAREGLGVLFITHKMDEIAALATNVTVLRSGETVARLPVAEATPARMLELMSSRGEDRRPASTGAAGPTLLSARALVLRDEGRPFDLDLRAGEILGLAGLEGHGADEAAQMLGGALSPRPEGALRSPDRDLKRSNDFVEAGVAYVPRDRKREGIFSPLAIGDNFAMASLPRHTRLGVIDARKVEAARKPLFEALGVKFGRLTDPITSLSGGNQQKVVLARMLALDPLVLVLNDPTRGVDLATKQDIYVLLRQLARNGVAVALHSTELEELLTLADRVAVFHAGTLWRVFDSEGLSREALIAGLFGREA